MKSYQKNKSQSITSCNNSNIKYLASLRKERRRKSEKCVLVEGYREVMHAFDSIIDNIVSVQVFYCKDLLQKYCKDIDKFLSNLPKGADVYLLSDKVFSKVSYGDRQEGLIVVFKLKNFISNIKSYKEEKQNPFYLICENIEKPGNLGAILRVCDAVSVDMVILTDTVLDIYNPNVIRTSIGSVFTVPIACGSNDEVYKFLKDNNIKVYSITPEARNNYVDQDFTGPIACIVGSEHKGISTFWKKSSDISLSIPMKGKMDSLNVSMSAGVLLYEVLRQRSG